MSIRGLVSLDGHALLNVATFLTQLADFAQEHAHLGGKGLAEFV